MATENVLVVTIDGEPINIVVPIDDPAALGQLLLDKIANTGGDGVVSTMHAQVAHREIP